MYAIVNIAGQQFKVERGLKVYVHRLKAEEGADVEFDNVLLIDNGGKISVGSPAIDGARVAASVIQHVRGDKVLIFKKKRRKSYQKLSGHRQDFTQIIIQGILAKGETMKDKLAANKPAGKPVLERRKKVEAAPVAEAKAEKKAPAKKAAAKKAAAPKKAAAKKTTKKKED
jgi:large subunit ribosomal protein L21